MKRKPKMNNKTSTIDTNFIKKFLRSIETEHSLTDDNSPDGCNILDEKTIDLVFLLRDPFPIHQYHCKNCKKKFQLYQPYMLIPSTTKFYCPRCLLNNNVKEVRI